MGDARGRWEGNTLVVETTNFNPHVNIPRRDREPAADRALHAGISPNQVEWSVTVDDPKTWTRPWTFAMHLTKDDEPGDLRVRLPRGELRPAQHPERGARRGESGAVTEVKRTTDYVVASPPSTITFSTMPPPARLNAAAA